MPQVAAFDATPAPSTTQRGVGAVLRNLPATAVLLAACVLLATTAFNRSAGVTDTPRQIPAPSAAPLVAPASDPSVADASTVFSGREVEVKEAIQAF